MCLRDRYVLGVSYESTKLIVKYWKNGVATYLTDGTFRAYACLLYTSDAADERSSVDLGGRRIIKKKNR